MDLYKAWEEYHWQGKAEGFGESLVLVPLRVCPPESPHGLAWCWTQASAVTGGATNSMSYGKTWYYRMTMSYGKTWYYRMTMSYGKTWYYRMTMSYGKTWYYRITMSYRKTWYYRMTMSYGKTWYYRMTIDVSDAIHSTSTPLCSPPRFWISLVLPNSFFFFWRY